MILIYLIFINNKYSNPRLLNVPERKTLHLHCNASVNLRNPFLASALESPTHPVIQSRGEAVTAGLISPLMLKFLIGGVAAASYVMALDLKNFQLTLLRLGISN
jgi:hypothetical protein